MKPFRTIAIAALAAGVAGSAVTAFAQGGGDWAGGAQMQGKGPMGWHMGGKGPGHGKGFARMFEKFDQNSDGVITQDEVNAVIEARFKAGDKDGNGSVTLDEFSEAVLAESKPMQVRVFQRLDRDGDGTVTTEEFDRATDRMFSRLDRDGDGVLAPAPRGEPGKGKRDGGKDGKGRADREGMMPGMGQGMGPGHGMGSGQGMGMEQMGGGMFALIAQFDKDQDGKVSREEFEAGRAKIFALADTDGSGGFSLQDFPAIWLEVTKPHTVRMFQRFDANGDLGLTQEEMAGPMADLVEDMDRNGDGVVTKADFRHGKRHDGRGPEGKRDGDRGGRHGMEQGGRDGHGWMPRLWGQEPGNGPDGNGPDGN
ncbi:EF-hand domain-containing protein [Roseibium litorale]|uniref:EF-hand domain-containing protein n=1 Tax=Roseibium litorale TaxID=2803841 RepID=A0ABR9CUU5_9HYPH|nr:EF-hand domain-containing protein [Roseibium litorale]MBD8893997.1 EF-hand domain-containing protein [Roseibium litorale]